MISEFKVKTEPYHPHNSPVSKEECVVDADYNSKNDSWADERKDEKTGFYGVYENVSYMGELTWSMQLRVSPYYRIQEAGFTSTTSAAYARDKAVLMHLNICRDNAELHQMALNFPQHKEQLLKQLARDPNARTHPNREYLVRHDLKSLFRPITHPSRDPPQIQLSTTPSRPMPHK